MARSYIYKVKGFISSPADSEQKFAFECSAAGSHVRFNMSKIEFDRFVTDVLMIQLDPDMEIVRVQE